VTDGPGPGRILWGLAPFLLWNIRIEASLACRILNTMAGLGMPDSVCVQGRSLGGGEIHFRLRAAHQPPDNFLNNEETGDHRQPNQTRCKG
jgi:hypothetical protein